MTLLLVCALCVLGGVASAAATEPHSAVADGAPGAPTDVTATAAQGFGGARVTWTAPSDVGGSAITGYTVNVYNGSGQQVQKLAAGASATSSSVGNLTIGSTYTLTVQANNNLGSGPASSPGVSVKPVGCSSSLSAADPSGPVHQAIAGWAFIARGYELSHATVSLRTLGGRRIRSASTRTGPTGAFTLSPLARDLPRTFVVSVRGRFIGRRRLVRPFVFSALVHRRDLDRIVYVGLASTVLLDYLRAHPRVADGTAASRVRHMLGIPKWHDLGYNLYNISPRWYSAAKIVHLAATRGGLNRLVNALAQAVRRGGAVSRPPLGSGGALRGAVGSRILYPRQVQPYSSAWFMLNLSGGVVSAVGSSAAGWLFNAIGLNPTPSYIKTIEDQLNRLQAELEQLEDEVSALNVLVQQTYYAQQSNQLTDARSAIDTAMEDEAWLATDTDGASQWHFSQVYFCRDIKPIATNDKPWASTRVLFTNVLVNVMPPQKPLALQGAILLRDQGADYPFWTVSDSQNVFELADYWNQYAVEALDVYLEYEHGIGEQQYCDNPPTDAACPLQNETDLTQKLVDNVMGTLHNSQGTPLEPLPDGYTIDLRSGLMWCMFCSPAGQSYNAAVSGLSSGLYGGQPVLAFNNFKITGRQQFSNLLSGFTGGDRVKWLVDKAGLNPSWLNASTPGAPGHIYLWTTDVYSCGSKCKPAQYVFDLKTGSTNSTDFPEYSEYYLPARSIPKSEVYFPDQAP